MRLPTRLLSRRADSHKGDFGHVLVIAGSAGLSGAAVLCAEAAMRSGSGLVTIGLPESLNEAVIKIKPREVMTLPLPATSTKALASQAFRQIRAHAASFDVLAIGPGLGRHRSTAGLVKKVVSFFDKPIVLDADALYVLAQSPQLLKPVSRKSRAELVLTPHPGEMARLLGTDVKRVQSSREEIARQFSRRYRLTLVLKGRHTVVAGHRGELYINKTGNPGMATAGSGDVLTGIIASFIGQGMAAFAAAKYAVYLHGLAGDLAAREKTQLSLVASDIIGKLPQAIKRSS